LELRGPSFVETQRQSFFENVFSGNVFAIDFGFDDSLEHPEEFGFGHKAINEGGVMNDVQKGEVCLKVFKAGSE
jgi:hypothetical protein